MKTQGLSSGMLKSNNLSMSLEQYALGIVGVVLLDSGLFQVKFRIGLFLYCCVFCFAEIFIELYFQVSEFFQHLIDS